MASNYTTNYNLCQWQPTDQVQRTDFNADNARLEAALSSLEARVAELYRAVPNLAYSVYDLALKDYQENKTYGYRRSLVMDDFSNNGAVASLTGDLVIQDHALVLTGAGKTGTMTTINNALTGVSWERVIAWVRYKSGGTYTVSVNGGEPLTMTARWNARTVEGEDCREMQLEGLSTGSNAATLTFTLETGTSDQAVIYNYGVLYL